MEARKYVEAFLEYQIAVLGAELAAWQSRGWATDSLEKSFADAAAHAALAEVWDGEAEKLRLAHQKALADHAYGQRKIQHLYL